MRLALTSLETSIQDHFILDSGNKAISFQFRMKQPWPSATFEGIAISCFMTAVL